MQIDVSKWKEILAAVGAVIIGIIQIGEMVGLIDPGTANNVQTILAGAAATFVSLGVIDAKKEAVRAQIEARQTREFMERNIKQ